MLFKDALCHLVEYKNTVKLQDFVKIKKFTLHCKIIQVKN